MSVAHEPKGGPNVSARYVWYMILLLSIVNAFNYMDRTALAVLAPSIKTDLTLSDRELGLLIGFAFSVFYAICGVPIARWADRGVRRDIVALAVATWSVMTALSGAAQKFWHLFLARVAVGAGEAGGLGPAQSMICDYVPLERRSGMFAIHNFGLVAGLMLGMVLAGWLGETLGWRWTFVVLGLPGLVLAVVVRLTLREPIRGFFDVRKDDGSLPFGKTVEMLWRCRTWRFLVVLVVVNGFVTYGLNQWWPSFYVRAFGLNISTTGVYLGVALGAGSGIGLLLGGLLANKAAERGVGRPLIVGAVATSLALPAAWCSLMVSSWVLSMLLVALTGILWSVANGPVIATMTSVVTSRMRATSQAISVFLTSVLGFGLGPFCVGLLSDLLAPSLGGESLRYALFLPTLLIPVMVIALLAAARALPDDLRAGHAKAGNDSDRSARISMGGPQVGNTIDEEIP